MESKIRIGILGSRELCVNITAWIIQQPNVTIVGIVPPPFNGWWNDTLRSTITKLNIPEVTEEELFNIRPDIVFSINYWKKISSQNINMIPLGIVNIHHSYRLRFKGRYSTSWAIINARKDNYWKHGTTLHYIDNNFDEGKIIDSRVVCISEDDTAESVFTRVEFVAFEMFKDNFKKMLIGSSSFIAPSVKTYFFDINSNKNLQVEYGIPIEELYDIVRAWSFKGRPHPYFMYKNKKIYLSLDED